MKLLIYIIITIILAGAVMGTCVVPTEDILINVSTVLCTDTYQLNDSNANGSIIINGHNVILDCNGSTINGNDANNTFGIRDLLGHENVTIKNCIVSNYWYGIYVRTNQNFMRGFKLLDTVVSSGSRTNVLIEMVNNTLVDNLTSIGCSDSALYISSGNAPGRSFNTTIKNSLFENNKNGLHFNAGANDYVYYLNVYNNTFYNNTRAILDDGSAYSNFTDNTFQDNRYSIWTGGDETVDNYKPTLQSLYTSNIIYDTITIDNQTNGLSFINNIYPNGFIDFTMELETGIFDINETSLDYLRINFSDGGKVKIVGNFRKDLRVDNNSIQIYSLPTYNVIFTSDSASPNATDATGQHNFTLGSGERVFVISRDSATDPYPTSIAMTITDMGWEYTSGTSLTYSCTGTGTSTITGLSALKGKHGEYIVRHAGALVGYSSNTTYTTDSCSDWNFTRTDMTQEATETKEATQNSLLKLADKFPMIATVICAAVIIVILMGMMGGTIESTPEMISLLMWAAIMLVVFGIFLMYGINLVGGLT